MSDNHYVSIGTPVPQNTRTDQSKSLSDNNIPIYKQQVFDDRGRQRLHGAFQGGFSAGYYNTVGSKEGWTPTAYKSSRNENITTSSATPFDFMDDEDVKEFGGRDLIEKEFGQLGTTAREIEKRRFKLLSSSGTGPQLLRVTSTGLGRQVLQKLGLGTLKIINDIPLINPLQKVLDLVDSNLGHDNYHPYGRGFNPLDQAPEFQKYSEEKNSLSKNKGLSLTGFGTGIFDYENDDVEAYDNQSQSQTYSKEIIDTEYDIEFNDESQDQKIKTSSGRRSDGKFKATTKNNSTIDGFVLHKQNFQAQKIYLAPYPPLDFTPQPILFNESSINTRNDLQSKLHTGSEIDALDSKSSIFNYISQKNKQRLQAFINQSNSKSDVKPEYEPTSTYTVSTKYAISALKGFMPFGDDQEKQNRYIDFLQDIIKQSATTEPTSVYKEQIAGESREFSKAAMLYRPLSEMISNRFVNESEIPVEPIQPKVIVLKRMVRSWRPCKILCRRFAVAYQGDEDEEEEVDKEILNSETMKILMDDRDSKIASGELGQLGDDDAEGDLIDTGLLGQSLVGEEHEAIVIEKPSMDLFKAIFGDSNDDDDNDDDDDLIEAIGKSDEVNEQSKIIKDSIIPEKVVSPRSIMTKDHTSIAPDKDIAMLAGTVEEIITVDVVDELKHKYIKPIKRNNSNSLNAPRKKKNKVKQVFVGVDDVIVATRVVELKMRPSASDYM